MRLKYRIPWIKDKIIVWFRATRRRIMYHWFSSKKLLKLQAIKKNEYRDTDTLIFESIFQNLVNFVEREKSRGIVYLIFLYNKYLNKELSWDKLPGACKHPFIIGYNESSRWDRFVNRRKWRMYFGQLVLELEVENTGKDSDLDIEKELLAEQSKVAQEILELYRWYKFERPNRPDPWNDSIGEPEFPYLKNGEHVRSVDWNEDSHTTQAIPGAWPLEELWVAYADFNLRSG